MGPPIASRNGIKSIPSDKIVISRPEKVEACRSERQEGVLLFLSEATPAESKKEFFARDSRDLTVYESCKISSRYDA